VERRTQTRPSPEKFFEEILYSSLHWPAKTVRLDRSSSADFSQRVASAEVSIAELYHENSKLYPQMVSTLDATRVKPDLFRRYFVERRARAVRARASTSMAVDEPWHLLLSGVSKSLNPELFYAVELRLLVGRQVAVHVPMVESLQLIKRLSAKEVDDLRIAVTLIDGSKESLRGDVFLFVVGNFARNDILFGPRGYRRTLLEAGLVTQQVLNQAEKLGIRADARYEFTDHDLDALLEADGTEESVLAAVEMEAGHG
jgi:hypothetical protein